MSGDFGLLHYRGDVTGAHLAQPGSLLGCDEAGRPFEVIDAEYDPAADGTSVHLQFATPDTLRAHIERLRAGAS